MNKFKYNILVSDGKPKPGEIIQKLNLKMEILEVSEARMIRIDYPEVYTLTVRKVA